MTQVSSGKERESVLTKVQAGLFWYSPDFLSREGQLVSWLPERPATIPSPFPASGWRTKCIPKTDIVLWMVLFLGGLIGLKVELDWDKNSRECPWALLFHFVCSLQGLLPWGSCCKPGGARVEPRGWKVRSVSSLYKRCPGVLPGDSSSPGSGSVRGFLFLTSNKECSFIAVSPV